MKIEEKKQNEIGNENINLEEKNKEIVSVLKSLKKQFNSLELKYWYHGNSVFRTVLHYCNNYGLDRFLENENIIDYSVINSYSSKIIIYKDNSELPENYWWWISDNLEKLRFNILNYSSARDEFLKNVSIIFWDEDTNIIEEYSKKMAQYIKEMEKNIEEIEKNPMLTLKSKLWKIDEKLYLDNRKIDYEKSLGYIQEELNELSREIDKELYEDLVILFPEIKDYQNDDIEHFKREKERFYKNTMPVDEWFY